MVQSIKNKLKEQNGFTLLGFPTFIIISIGIIVAIVFPSISGAIDNIKNEVHVANAKQMISAAKMLIASDSTYQYTSGKAKYVSLGSLIRLGYLNRVHSPEKESYITDLGAVAGSVPTPTADSNDVSFVKIKDGKVVGVKLLTTVRGISIVGTSEISTASVTRKEVKLKAILTPLKLVNSYQK